MKKLLCLALAIAMTLSFTACAETSGNSTINMDADIDALIEKTNVIGTGDEIVPMDELEAIVTGDKIGFQTEMPEKGEEIAVITTTKGVIKLRFFPLQAPKTVYNFKKLALTGYYDGITFHRVFEDFMIQGGDPTATGAGGESIWGEAFDDEFSGVLYNIRGSVAMANPGAADSNGSQFFVNTCTSKTAIEGYASYFNDYFKENKDAIVDLYAIDGGNAHLDGAIRPDGLGHTVFAQVFNDEGLTVADKISKAFADDKGRPTDDVIIESIEIVTYEG